MRDHPDALMLFAAGFGTRMGALTAALPKPLIKVAGRALIDHALALVDGVPLARKALNLHYLPEQIKAHLAHRTDIAFSLESPAILETGGGLRQALPLLGYGPVFTLNTDAIWAGPNPLMILRQAWIPRTMDALLLLIPEQAARGHVGPGDFTRCAGGRITRGGDHIYVGAQIIRTETLHQMAAPVFSLNRLWDQMIATGRAYGAVYPGHWCDVGQPGGIQQAEAMLADV